MKCLNCKTTSVELDVGATTLTIILLVVFITAEIGLIRGVGELFGAIMCIIILFTSTFLMVVLTKDQLTCKYCKELQEELEELEEKLKEKAQKRKWEEWRKKQ